MAEITLDGVSKVFADGFEAVKDMDLDIQDGEFMILVGPSGCGKSTALRMIAGLEDISEGEVFIGDRVVNDLSPRDRDIAMVFQNYALYPHMTVRENMGFALKLAKVPQAEIDKKVEDAARTLDLTWVHARERLLDQLFADGLQLLDQRLRLLGDVEPPRPAVLGVARPLDQPGFLQPVDDPRQGDRLHIEHFGQFDLAQARKASQPEEHLPLRASHAERRGPAIEGSSQGVSGFGNFKWKIVHGRPYNKPAY
jgi:hypothetical protein